MRVLLQNTETKLYLTETNEWTDDPLRATDFQEVEQAAETYHTLDLAYAQIVVEPGPAAPPTARVVEMLRAMQAQG